MKKVFLILTVAGVIVTYFLLSSATKYSTDSKKVFLEISNNTTKAELISISYEFKQKNNISIDFSESIFKANGKIKKLHLQVDCNDGMKGTTTCLGGILKLTNYGFCKYYDDKSMPHLKMGAM